MPRIPRVTEADPVHERIMRSLGPPPVVPRPDAVVVPVGDPAPSLAEVVEPTNAEVRAWAAEHYDGEVSASGPIPKAVREAYDAAHAG